MPETGTDVVVEESLDWDIACEREQRRDDADSYWGQLLPDNINPCGGTGRAEWVLWFSCGCPPVYVLYCTPCKDAVLTFTGRFFCPHCEKRFHPASTAYGLIEPLNRGKRP